MKLLLILILILSFKTNAQNSKEYTKELKIPITSNSDQAKHYFALALEFENKKEPKEALTYLNKAVGIDSTFAMAYMKLGHLCGDFELAKQYMGKAMQYLERVSAGERYWIMGMNDFYGNGEVFNEYVHFEKLATLYPEDENAQYLFGMINFNHGNHDMDKAIKHLKKAIALAPDFTDAYNELAYAYLEISNYEQARQAALKNTTILPNNPNVYDTLAEILMREGNYKESIRAYDQVLKLNPSYPWAIMGIAANQNFLEEHKEARNTLKQLDTIKGLKDYEYRHKWKSLVVSYLDEGDLDSALEVLEHQKKSALEGMSTREPYFHGYFSFLRRIIIYFEKGDFKSGLEEYRGWQNYVSTMTQNEKSLKNVKNSGLLFRAWASILQDDLHQTNKLLDTYLKSVDKPNDRYRWLKSKLFMAEGQTDLALKVSKTLDLNDYYNQYHHGLLLQLSNKPLEASNFFKKVCLANDRNSFELGLVRRRALQYCQ